VKIRQVTVHLLIIVLYKTKMRGTRIKISFHYFCTPYRKIYNDCTTSWTTRDPGLHSRWGGERLFCVMSRPTNQPHRMCTGSTFPAGGGEWPGRENEHSRPSSAEVKNLWSYTSIPPGRNGAVFNEAQRKT
jgi:hypothetical protein